MLRPARTARAGRAPVRPRVRGSRGVSVHSRLEPGARAPEPAIRLPTSISAQGAEGEGFEPSIRLTTDNGFRAPALLAWIGASIRLRDMARDSRPRRNATSSDGVRQRPAESAGVRQPRLTPGLCSFLAVCVKLRHGLTERGALGSLGLCLLGREEDSRDVLLGGILAAHRNVDGRCENRGDRDREQDGEAAEEDPNCQHGHQHE